MIQQYASRAIARLIIAPDRCERPRPIQVLCWTFLLVFVVTLSLSDYDSFQIGTWRDDAHYAILAQSLVYADRYGLINTPGMPGTTQYPFGYPLLLTSFVFLAPAHLDALKVLSLLALVLNISLIFWGWLRLSRRTSYWWGLAAAGLYALLPWTIEYSRMVMSEPIFITFCLAALLVTEQIAREKRPRAWQNLLLGSLLMLGMFIRTIGIVLTVTAFGYLLLARGARGWREICWTLAGIVVLLGLIVTTTPVRADDLIPVQYLDALRPPAPSAASAVQSPRVEEEQKNSPIDNLKWYLQVHIRDTVLPHEVSDKEFAWANQVGIPSLPLLAGGLISALIALGYIRWFREGGLSIFLLFSILYFGTLLLWPWRQPRFLYPIQPQLLFTLLLGIEGILVWTSQPRWLRSLSSLSGRMLGVIVLMLMIISTCQSLRIENSRLHVGDLQRRTGWLKANSSITAVIMTEEPQVDFIYCGRKTVLQPDFFSSADDLGNYLVKEHIDYVLVAPQILWQPSYSPTYSQNTVRLLALLHTLVLTPHLRQVYSSDQELISIFQVQD